MAGLHQLAGGGEPSRLLVRVALQQPPHHLRPVAVGRVGRRLPATTASVHQFDGQSSSRCEAPAASIGVGCRWPWRWALLIVVHVYTAVLSGKVI